MYTLESLLLSHLLPTLPRVCLYLQRTDRLECFFIAYVAYRHASGLLDLWRIRFPFAFRRDEALRGTVCKDKQAVHISGHAQLFRLLLLHV
jgi:hypothetical protein